VLFSQRTTNHAFQDGHDAGRWSRGG
jgi:hypothetical protein